MWDLAPDSPLNLWALVFTILAALGLLWWKLVRLAWPADHSTDWPQTLGRDEERRLMGMRTSLDCDCCGSDLRVCGRVANSWDYDLECAARNRGWESSIVGFRERWICPTCIRILARSSLAVDSTSTRGPSSV